MFSYRPTRCLIVILFQVICIQAYILSENETPWDNVVCSNGTIATIDVQHMQLDVTLGDNAYRINNENSRLPTDMTSAWVGYYQFPVGFEYIGCVVTGDISLKTYVTMQPINGDPGHCFLGCSDVSIIGVNNEECYCVDENLLEDESIETGNNYCNVECAALPGVACGRTKTSSRGSLSLYRRNDQVTSIKNYDGNCLSVEPNEDDYEWQACRTSLEVQCLMNDGNTREYGLKNWYYAGLECIKNGWKPLPYFEDKSKLQQMVKTSSRFWTGIFKTYALFKVSNPPPDWVNFTSPDLRFGVLEYNTTGGYHYLHFVEEGNDTRRALCKSDSEATTTTTSTIGTTSLDDKTTSYTTSTLSGSNIEPPTTNNKTLMIGVIAGVCSFVAIVIIVVSIILVKRKPCRSVTKKQTGGVDIKTGSGNDNEAYSVVGGHQRAPSAGNNSEVDYNYLDVELSSNPKIENKSGDLPNIYSHAESRDVNKADDTYDTTITSRKEGQPSGENMYNNFGDDENTYNTTNNTQQNQQDGHRRKDDIYNKLGDENEDTYDSTVTKRQHTGDAIYDKTMTSSGDDTYSQINKTNKPKITQTDNVYGSVLSRLKQTH